MLTWHRYHSLVTIRSASLSTMAACFSTSSIPNSQTLLALQCPQPLKRWRRLSTSFQFTPQRAKCRGVIRVSMSASPEMWYSPDDLVTSILSKFKETDRGVSLTKEQHMEVSQVATQLQRFCVDEQVKRPLICGGKLNVLDSKGIQVIFEPPVLRVGGLEFQYGGESEVKLQITYIDEKCQVRS